MVLCGQYNKTASFIFGVTNYLKRGHRDIPAAVLSFLNLAIPVLATDHYSTLLSSNSHIMHFAMLPKLVLVIATLAAVSSLGHPFG
jgi:hypothetical protein